MRSLPWFRLLQTTAALAACDINQLAKYKKKSAKQDTKQDHQPNHSLPPLLSPWKLQFVSYFSLLDCISVVAQCGRDAQNSRGWVGPVGRMHMWVAEPSSVLKPSAGLWDGGCFLVHASGQSCAEHTLGYFCSGPFFFLTSHILPSSILSLPSPFKPFRKQCMFQLN